jgi:hypothetical protein
LYTALEKTLLTAIATSVCGLKQCVISNCCYGNPACVTLPALTKWALDPLAGQSSLPRDVSA